MTTMLEKAALALAADMKRQADSVEPKYSGSGMVDPDHFADRPLVVTVDHTFHLDELARAVLMAVREPGLEVRSVSRFSTAEMEWPRMIDAILKQEPAA